MKNDELILKNIPLIYKCIKDMNCYWRTDDEWQDLYDAGMDGLIKGAKAFDGTKGYKVSSYLYPCIKNEISRWMYLSEMPKRKLNKELISLDRLISNDSNTTYIDMLEDSTINIEEDILKKIEIQNLMGVINKILTPTQKKYLCQYYGLCGYSKTTLEKIAEGEKCSRQNVQQKISNSMKKLEQYLSQWRDK